MSESISIQEREGAPLPPPVELRPAGPPLTITEAGPLPPPPPPPPFDRAAALAAVQTAFALLTDEELQVCRLRLLGMRLIDIEENLPDLDEPAEVVWKRARAKLGGALFRRE